MVKSIRLPERLRMVKLLRAHGLRHAERLREDELKSALQELGLALDEGRSEPLSTMNVPSSGAIRKPPSPPPPEPPPSVEDDRFDDPHAAPFFREPKIAIPEGQRTFLRLIAVDWRHVFATWDLAGDAWNHLSGGVELRLVPAEIDDVLDPGYALLTEKVDARARGWYLRIEDLDRAALVAVLLTFDDGAPRLLAKSNVAIVPPSRPAPPGPLWFATISPHADRRRLKGGALLRALAGEDVELPEGASVTKTGRTVGPAGEPFEVGASESFPRRTPETPPATWGWSGTLQGGAWSGTSARRAHDDGRDQPRDVGRDQRRDSHQDDRHDDEGGSR